MNNATDLSIRTAIANAIIAERASADEPDWAIEGKQYDHLTRLVRNSDGAELLISYSPTTYTPNRVEIYGSHHAVVRGESRVVNGYGEQRIECTFAPTRKPEHVARAVARKLLPVYLERYARAFKRAQLAANHVADVNAEAAKLAAIIQPVYPDLRTRDDEPGKFSWYASDAPHGSVRVCGGEYGVDIKIDRLPVDLARQVLALLADAQGETSS